ncbi:MAG: AgmX/PglI C-terminal domain-containing protein [Myxococcales bacterium]
MQSVNSLRSTPWLAGGVGLALWLVGLSACNLTVPQFQTQRQKQRAERAYTDLHGACEARDWTRPELSDPDLKDLLADRRATLSACFEKTPDLIVDVAFREGSAELVPAEAKPTPPEDVSACVLRELGEVKAVPAGTVFGVISHERVGLSREPIVIGSVSQDSIREAIDRQMTDVHRCYEDGLVWWPNLAGRVVIEFHVRADGTVQSANVLQDELGQSLVACCIAHSVRNWAMPKPDGHVIVTYPFDLEPPLSL